MAKYKPGQSGNLRGRPKGTGTAQRLRELLTPHAEALIQKAVDEALLGDVAALKLCLERLVPVVKPIEQPVALEGLEGALADQGRAVLAAVSRGEINTAQAQQLLNAIAAQARVVEVEELLQRVEALEEGNGTQRPHFAA